MAWKNLFDKLKFKDDVRLEAGGKLVGYWILKNVGGKPPPLALHVFHFKVGGTWDSTSILLQTGGGHFELKGAGIWEIQEDILKYTAGQNSGETGIKVEDAFIALDQDPMLQLSEYLDRTCIYARSSRKEVDEMVEYVKSVGG